MWFALLSAVKAGAVSEAEAIERLERSPQWVWIAMDPESQLLLAIDVGDRTLAMAQCQARRQTLPAQVWALHRQGWTVRAIAQHIGLSERTVQRDLQTTTFAGRKRRSDCGHGVLVIAYDRGAVQDLAHALHGLSPCDRARKLSGPGRTSLGDDSGRSAP